MPDSITSRGPLPNGRGSLLKTHTLDGEPGRAPLGPMRRYLYAVHPAVERAELMHLLAEEHTAPLIHRKLGLLTRDTPTTSPWLTGFELLAELPWRPKKVKQWLSQRDAGIVESYISYLRRKIDPYSSEPLIQTKRGFGYMLKAGKSA